MQDVPVAAGSPVSAERLARALASLDAALTDQRVALAAWRGALSELRTSTTSLSANLQQFHGSLGTLGEQVGGLNAQARQLEQWADGALDQARS